VALAHATRLLDRDPLLAGQQAREILNVAPDQPNATLLLGIAHRAAGDPVAAVAVLVSLAARQPRWAAAHCELGLTLGILGRGEDAVAALRQAVELDPDLANAWRVLADHMEAMGDDAGAQNARGRFLKASTRDPRLLNAAAALCENRIPEAEALLRQHLNDHPTDIAAIRMFAEVAARLERYRDAENLLARKRQCGKGELAQRIGVTRQTIIAIEQGRYSPSLEVAFQIAQVFKMPLDEVFQYPGDSR